MKILVVGLPKSGTTILTYRIAAAVDDVAVEFEPLGGPDPDLADRSATVVTKKLVGSQTSSLADFAHYDRRIWICRDPRDFLISQSLYRWHREQPPSDGDRAWFDQALADLEAKEADPASVTFRSLEPADYSATFDAVSDLWRREGDDRWLLYRYEDMVAGRYDALDDYLGFAVDQAATVAPGLERVVRHKAAGDWRNWFTDDDVAHYAAGSLDRYMATFGYDRSDWALNPDPRIEPEHGSAYITGLFDDHRNLATAAGEASDPLPASSPLPSALPSPSPASSSAPVGTTRRILGRLRSRVR